MNIHVIRVNGEEEHSEGAWRTISSLIGADGLDTVNLRDGRVMLVDDTGAIDGKPVNPKATHLYHGVCGPGTTWEICGDVAIVWDKEVG